MSSPKRPRSETYRPTSTLNQESLKPTPVMATSGDVSEIVSPSGSAPDNGDPPSEETKGAARKPKPKRHEEMQFLDAVSRIMDEGVLKPNRTGIDTKTIFGMQMRFDLRDRFPLLTTKRVYWKGIVEELLWFIRGDTSTQKLAERGVTIWDAHATREYLDKYGFKDREVGDLGPIYGFQWRHYGAEYIDMHTDYTGQGIDQLAQVIDMIRNDPQSRRIILSSWNPVDTPKMALPTCPCLAQFCVMEGELYCQVYQRSADMGLGVPFDIATYSLLTLMIAHVTGLKPGELVHTLADAHVYVNHLDGLRKQVSRKPRPFPRVSFKRKVESIDDFKFEDIELENYDPHRKIQLDLVV